MNIHWGKDFLRAVDYLQTRQDVDMERLASYSLSMGASLGPIPVALEPRIKVAVLASGGLQHDKDPEVQAANFAPRVTIPVLVVHGKDDFGVSAASRSGMWSYSARRPPARSRLSSTAGTCRRTSAACSAKCWRGTTATWVQ